MKNNYALDKNNSLIRIESVKKELKEKYICCNCNGELIARKGKVKAHHFAHKYEGNCNYESYLHKLAKLKFFYSYKNCLQNKKPFYLEFKTEVTCNSCLDIKDIQIQCKLKDEIKRFDLTTYFDKITIEKGIDGFIADVLLESSTKSDVILIEFAVTHKCDITKIDSGLRILEIQLESDNDLKFIDYKYISRSNNKIEFLNFNVNHKIGKYISPKNCNAKFEFFSVHKDNTASKVKKTMSRIISEIESEKYKYFKVLEKQEDEYTGQDFIVLVQDYADLDRSFKNCYSCRFSANNNNYYAEYTLFCKRMKWELPSSNIGADCKKYWKLENPYQLK